MKVILLGVLLFASLSHAAPEQILIFSGSNTTNATFGVLVTNDLLGPKFIDYLNWSISLFFNATNETSDSIWNMKILAYRKVIEPPNFFVPEEHRAYAQRFLGYFADNISEPDLDERRQAMLLFDIADKAVPSQPAVLTDRKCYMALYALLILPLSFLFHQIKPTVLAILLPDD